MPALLLFLVATQLQSLLSLLHWAVALYDCVRYRQWGLLPEQFLTAAYLVDLTENVSKAQLLNLLFYKGNGVPYGTPDYTISSETGKNWTLGATTTLGDGLVGFLDVLDKNHCYKYIQHEGVWPHPMPGPVPHRKTALFVLCTLLLLSVLWILRWMWRAFCIYLAYQLYLWKNN